VPRVKVAHLLISGDVAGGSSSRSSSRARFATRGDAIFVAPARGPFASARTGSRRTSPTSRACTASAASRRSASLRDERVDVLHTHTLARRTRSAGSRRARAGVPSSRTCTSRTTSAPRRSRCSASPTTDRALGRGSSRLRGHEARVRAQGYPHRIEVVYNGVELDARGDGRLRAELGIPDDARSSARSAGSAT
jgi:hypothetical protein